MRKNPTGKVTRRGQITIPKPIRERLRIDEGDQVESRLEGREVVIRKKLADDPFVAWYGYLGRPGGSDELVRRMRGHDR